MDYKKEYEKIGNKPVSELTYKDKDILYNYYIREARSCFDMALGYAEECGIGELEDVMSEVKMMVFDVEDKGIDIGSMN